MTGKVKRERKKEEFTRKLKGDPIGYDAFGKPILEGDILLFAASQYRTAELRVIQVVETLVDEGYGANDQKIKFRIKRATRTGWGQKAGNWTLQKTTSIIKRLENVFLLENPPQHILDLFEEGTE